MSAYFIWAVCAESQKPNEVGNENERYNVVGLEPNPALSIKKTTRDGISSK
jgi:hypothetical protein